MSSEKISAPELVELNKFIGQWKTEGKILATDTTPEIIISGTDTYKWLPGEFFLVHTVDVLMGNDKNKTLEIIGFDKQTGNYTMQYFDNKGNSGLMTATVENGIWTFVGDSLKFIGSFKNNDKEFSGIWQQSKDGKNWNHFMDIKLIKGE